MSNTGFVAGAGSINIDLLYQGLSRLPREGEELFAQDFYVQLGGGVPATLINLSRLGIPTCLQTGLGEDLFSDFARQQLMENKITPVVLDGQLMPNITTAMLTPNNRTFVSYTAAQTIQSTAQTQQAVYEASRGAKIVLMQLGFAPVYHKLKQEGVKLVFDTGWDDALNIENYREYLQLADYYTPNRQEACKITGEADPHTAAQRLEQFFDQVIVKLDGEGCLIRQNGQEKIIPSIPEYIFCDATGAGDAFLAGFVYGLYHNLSFPESVLCGNITGGKCVTQVGCLTACHTENSLRESLNKYLRSGLF